ncbi:FGGY-family carbohydrate kinase [Gymnodinialimonas hymeniacidonis]|uniref:FGGY-family carbohydrate kinase n=1 Tax=Gymnodinialimonas hymeniacidonis TaxID=3126508 RepID=UPI0034C681EE
MTHVAVIDIGKTNAKLALVDRDSLSEIAVVTRPNIVRPGPPWPHFDLDGHWQFLKAALKQFHETHGVDAISITAHGASIVLLNEEGGLAAPMLDYEHPGPDDLAGDYAAIRPDFSVTGSPKLAGGLNVGAQLHWLFQQDPDLRDRTAQIVTYPQYWAFLLTGVAATDFTSLGCHTDLWLPGERKVSQLAATLGISSALAPVRAPADKLGGLLPSVAEATGLPVDTPVTCGVHDSNASLLPHLLTRTAPFSVVSTGTWIIAMTIEGAKVELDERLDTLMNVSAKGNPVPSARFMGGREFETICPDPSADQDSISLNRVLAEKIMLHPSFAPETGPFKGQAGGWAGGTAPESESAIQIAASFYCAMVTSVCLELTGHRGQIVVEGPFSKNKAFVEMLAAASGSPVVPAAGQTGTSIGAALLVEGPAYEQRTNGEVTPDQLEDCFFAYAEAWRSQVRNDESA